MKKELICFDMDNTILNSNKTHLTAFNKAFVKNGLRKVNEKKISSLFGIVRHKIIKKLYPKLNQKLQNKIFRDVHNIMINDTKKYMRAFNGAVNIIKKLKKKYKLALISNSRHDEILIMLKSAKVNRKLFDVILGNDDVEHPKPAPDGIFKAEELLHMKAIYMVGDTIYDVLAGKKAGIKTISVLSGNQPREIIEKTKPDYIVKDLTKIEKIFL